ncbi:MAG: type II toxin-antitoxin system prevent-host-death family antitoxin [Anaerolineae bacterium]
MTTKIMPATDLRAQIGRILDELTETGEPVFITRHGRAQAVLLNIATYDALIEQRVAPTVQAVSEPLAHYQTLLERIDFAERGDAAARRQHAQEVYEELAEARRRANAEMMNRE